MKIRHGLSALMFAAVIAGTSACGSATEPGTAEATSAAAAPESAVTTAGTGASASAEEATITIADFEYVMPETIAPGATVTVINEDDAPHTVTAKDEGGFDVDVSGGETVTFTAPDEAGEYAVICTYHPAMSGTLVIG
ncbi:cupredoxin domain-containing protein [Arthrobacter burdickii]|jgi:plastocyanin|uniref:Cupredoxin domain-containing protein n=1 Tax=Arthrobacter burdickii TaxID=3035920 RepID=A0ABT8K5I4_9MICC|nr:cupredoxin domain-containing protein [Arthrobacter burdickii]MDN4611579.1 cupredoxin domain-containing protein [Arthrobacter burdickii]